MALSYKEHRTLYMLLLVSFVLRGLMAAFIELGNDEVYYWTYAKYPDLSHFDHPPMVGYVIQLFSLNLLFDHEFFIRLASVVSGTISTYLIYRIGLYLGDRRTALFAAFLFTGSIYGSIISGIFIMPDTPLVPLWLFSLYCLLRVVNSTEVTASGKRHLLLAGITIGVAILSKYHAVFLWFGAVLYILIYDRKWLAIKELYISLCLTALCMLPILLWNWEHDFISFRFQGERVSFFEKGIRPDRFITELAGQFFYNNPFNFILTVIAVVSIFRGRKLMDLPNQRLLLFTALPLILIILFFSLFRKTLPHWSGPAYVTLIPIAAAYVISKGGKIYLKMISSSVSLLFVVLMVGALEINNGIFTAALLKKSTTLEKTGKKDLTLDLYGWRQFAGKFQQIAERDVREGIMDEKAPIIGQRWFTSAHLDYYVATPLHRKLLAFGSLNAIHKYAWINELRGFPGKHENAYYITHSRAYNPPDMLKPYFQSVTLSDTIPIVRSGHVAEYFFVYHLNNYQSNFSNPLPEF